MTDRDWGDKAVRLLSEQVSTLNHQFPSDGLIITIEVSGDAMECDIRAAGVD